MEIILLETIQNLGELGDQVKVKAGYARNYLIPQKKAVFATEEAKSKVEERRKELAKLEAERLDVAKARLELAVKSVTIARRAGEEGKLFGSVSPADIAEALTEAGSQTEKSEIQMPEGPIKELGEYHVHVQLHPEVAYELAVNVIFEED